MGGRSTSLNSFLLECKSSLPGLLGLCPQMPAASISAQVAAPTTRWQLRNPLRHLWRSREFSVHPSEWLRMSVGPSRFQNL